MRKITLAVLLMIVVALPLAAQNGTKAKGVGSNSGSCPNVPVSLATQPLLEQEAAWLLYMREEEKLALDAYQVLGSTWQLRIFKNIAASEKRHFDAIGTLIQRYGLIDPAAETGSGVFINPKIQALYDELMAKGAISIVDALEAGVLIEKTDIADLEAALAASGKTDIKTVYTNLLAGSLNHLDAFESNLEILGVPISD
jgi:hypothetical protein